MRFKVKDLEKKAEHQGWKNYETWATALWLDNDREMYVNFRNSAREILSEAGGDSSVAMYDLADLIKYAIEEENYPEMPPDLYSDLLGSAVQEIDYLEISQSILSEIQEG